MSLVHQLPINRQILFFSNLFKFKSKDIVEFFRYIDEIETSVSYSLSISILGKYEIYFIDKPFYK